MLSNQRLRLSLVLRDWILGEAPRSLHARRSARHVPPVVLQAVERSAMARSISTSVSRSISATQPRGESRLTHR
jgi:hypothetical protein